MERKEQFRIALMLYTQGLDYDDRIRKEILSLQNINPNVSFKIFAVEPVNREESGTTSYGVPYRIPYLKTRDRYFSGTHTLSKAWDFYKSVRSELKDFDAIWCADCETFLFVLLSCHNKVIWDLHELPAPFMGNSIKRWIFKRLESKCSVVIHANEARLKCLAELGMVKFPERHYVLRNYPQFNEIDSQYDERYFDFIKWLGDEKCVYLQGISGSGRADIESIRAVLSFDTLKAVVVGNVSKECKEQLVEIFGEETLASRIYFTGKVKQMKTPQYIKCCFMTLCFYKNVSLNNWYCEPNRLFQNVINANPVVVGDNPPMRDFVNHYKCGVCVSTDGSDIDKIVEGMHEIINNYEYFKRNSIECSSHILWDSQENVLHDIYNQIIS